MSDSVTPITYRADVSEPYGATLFPLGERESTDVRDEGFLMSAALPDVALPSSRFYNLYPYPVQNQNRCHAEGDRTKPDPLGCGHCVGYGSKHILLLPAIRNPSPQFTGSDIYHMAQEVDEWSGENYQGTSARAGMKVLQSLGYITAYVWSNQESVVRQWILSGKGPVGISSNWYYEMFFPQRHGGYLVDQGANAGGHFWVLDGYSGPRGAYRMLNSWGGSWGASGRAWVKPDVLKRLMGTRSMAAVSPTEVLKA